MNRSPRNQADSGKAKDFKAAISRLMKELKNFKILIVVSLILACLGSIISIFAPDILSELTDKISEGLIVNKENLTKLSDEINASLNSENSQKVMTQLINLNLSESKIKEILISTEYTIEEKEQFQESLQKIKENKDQTKIFTYLSEIPTAILTQLLNTSEINGINVSVEDKIKFIDFSNRKENANIPISIANLILKDLEIDNIKITIADQTQVLNLMVSLSEESDATELYKSVSLLPENVQTLIEPFMDIDEIKQITFLLVALYLISALFSYIQSITMTNVSNKFARELRKNISTKINRLPLKYFDRNSTGDTLSRVTNDVDTIAQSMNQSLATLVSALTLFIGTIIMMFVTNWVMALTAIISSLIGFVFMFKILGKSQKYFIARQKGLGNLNAHIEEVYSGLNVVKAYNGKRISDEKFDKLNQKMYDANRKSQFLSGLMMPMMNFIGNFGYVAVCIVGALLVSNNSISFGVIVAFIVYVRLFTSPLSQIAQAMTSLQSTAAASERVFEFLDEEEMSNQKEIKKHLDSKEVKGKIEFENVTFKYDGNDSPTIKNFTATALPGQKIAIVGPTGAGKTTMINLLMKFYEISSGDIKIDGISIKELSRENIHNLFTMVLQDTWLFNGTIKENIIYNRKNVSDKRVKDVCEIVGLDHFIKTLPNGYDSDVSDNDSVSAGQRQLLTIARGMIEDSPFLILDEATSNVDTRTEELVQKAMDKLTEGRTSFIIAHRLSTIKNADLILVMKDGNIIEQGNHEQLMEKNGFYAELYNSQFEL